MVEQAPEPPAIGTSLVVMLEGKLVAVKEVGMVEDKQVEAGC